MSYSDRDLQVATQIAYYDLNKDLKKYQNKYSNVPTLRELLAIDASNKQSIQESIKDNLKKAQAKNNTIDIQRFTKQEELYNEIVYGNSPYGNWKIVDIRDTNSENGFYACTIETNSNSAIVGFRGSEGIDVPNQAEYDWVDGDIGLLNSKLTTQQAQATRYMNDISNGEKFKKYSSFALTGHSLGGNLSDHATLTAPDYLQKRITQSVSFDGPNFSNEYINDPTHQAEIQKMRGKMIHYQWSVVGTLLVPLPGVENVMTKTNEYVYGKNDLNSLIFKHDTGFLLFDEKGDLENGITDPFADSLGKISREIDAAPSWAGNGLKNGIGCFLLAPKGDKVPVAISELFLACQYIQRHPGALGDIVGLAKNCIVRIEYFGEKVSIPLATLVVVTSAFDRAKAVQDNCASNYFGSENTVRDFTDQALARFVGITNDVEYENPIDITKWDVWYRVENMMGGLNVQAYSNDMNSYYQKILDINDITTKKMKDIFSKVYEIDSRYAKKVNVCNVSLKQIANDLKNLADNIH